MYEPGPSPQLDYRYEPDSSPQPDYRYEPGPPPQPDYRYEPDSSPQPDYRLERLDDAAGAYLDVEFQPHRPAGANQPDVRPFIRAAERPAAGEVRVECGAPPVARA